MCLSLVSCSFFPESSFELAPESRLPRWFTLPPGRTRADVSVRMSYYIKAGGHTATFVLHAAGRGQALAEASGVVRGLEPLKLKKPAPGFPEGYPSYSIITVKGITEIVEQRKMEPIFYLTDDPAVWAELGVPYPAGQLQ